jgi:hypothetical protein
VVANIFSGASALDDIILVSAAAASVIQIQI